MSAIQEIGGEQLAATIEAIRARQRERVFAITQQSRADRACEAYIASALGYRGSETPEEERTKFFKQAAKLRAAIEKGGDGGEHAALASIIVASAAGRKGFDQLRDTAEREMTRLAASLQVAPWVDTVPGFGLRGLSVIIGEAGDLAEYSGPAKLWKRLGLAPFNGRAASTWRRSGGLSDEEWKEVGFKPSRLGQIYGVVTAPLFFAKSKSVYGLVYAEAKARYDQRVIETADLPAKDKDKWTPKRADMAARRYMTKRLLRDLWRAWREAIGIVSPKPGLPPAANS